MNKLDRALVAIDHHAGEADPVVVATAKGLMRGYHDRWRSEQWQTLAIEQEFELPLINPDTGRHSRTWSIAGKIDGMICRGPLETFLLEHKTTSEDVSEPDATYWRQLAIDQQVNHYMLAMHQLGHQLDGVVYDVIRKPGIAPKKIPKVDMSELTFHGTYLGQPVSLETMAEVRTANDGMSENAELYGIRLHQDTLSRPDRYFQRKTIYRNDHQLLEYARELWQTADEMRMARISNRHYRNSGACMQWGRPCEYLGICSGYDEPTSDKWVSRPTHTELELIKEPERALTNSRLATFKSCRAKHNFRYQLAITKGETSDSLFFGSLFHKALEAWWTTEEVNNVGTGADTEQVLAS